MRVPRLSVILPVFNAEQTLDAAVESIVTQSMEDWELIAVDDGSTDASLSILRAYETRDARVRVISSAHGGIVTALQRGCAVARGGLLARMDADDISLPARLSEQAALFDHTPGLALCGARIQTLGSAPGLGRRRYDAWINNLVRHEDIARELFVECPLPHPTFMMPRYVYERLGGYREMGWPEDYDLILRVWQAGGRFGKPEPVLLHWREHPGRLSMNDPRYAPEAFRRLKRHFLFQTCLKDKRRAFIQWGAGEVGKRWLREWPVPPVAVVDVHPRKIGRSIHGVKVIARDALPPPGSCFILVAVGARGARDEIREYLEPRGYHETDDYLFIA